MAVLSRVTLSGSPSGKPINITSTSSPGTTLHACASATQITDTLYLSLFNYATTNSAYNLELGGTTSDSTVAGFLPAQSGVVAILGGHTLNGGTATGANNTLTVGIYATGAGRIAAFGYSDRAT